MTRCVLAVMVLGLLFTHGATARAGEGRDPLEVDRALRRILRTNLPLPERLAAATEVLESVELADGETLARAAGALAAEAPRAATWLLLAGTDRAYLDAGVRQEIAGTLGTLLAKPEADPRARAHWMASALLVAHRPDDAAEALTTDWPPPEAVRAVLRREVALEDGILDAADGQAAVHAAIQAQRPAARRLDQAVHGDPDASHEALVALERADPPTLALLLHVARGAARGVPEGRLPRATRAVLALGLAGRREATPVLVACLDAPDGWIEAAAATALGDLGDPAAAIPLCHKLTYRGDILRSRDQWDYPGERETNVPRTDWALVPYFVIDGAAADALLRMGVPGAVEWLVRNQMDPTKANFRVRVLQDAVDALRRAVPSSPWRDYNVDAGFPQRRAAFEALLAWWDAHAFDADLLGRQIDANDEGFRREARRMAERLRGKSIMELQISQETCAILGHAVTPTLLETLAATESRVLRTEIARALGVVRDPRAVEPLLALAGDRASFLRAVAATSLGAYVGRDERVVPALLRLLDDAEAAPRVAALAQLVRVAPRPAVRGVLEAHPPAAYRERFGADDRDYRMAWTVALLVQAGPEHWPPVRAWLGAKERYVRRNAWDLLRRALELPNLVYDANTDPDAPTWRPIDETRVQDALRRRGSP